ncbi:MAG TPA: translocation/assembly module TamB domain-containing protein [bacterium]
MKSARIAFTVAAGTLAALLLLAAAFRGPLLERLIVRALHCTLGLDATLAQAGGSIFGGIELRGLKARGAGPIASFEAERVAATYSLAALARGREAFFRSLAVTVSGGALDLDLTRPRPASAGNATPPAPAPGSGAVAGRAPAFPALPRLEVRGSRLRLRGSGYEIVAEGLQGDVGAPLAGQAQPVDARAERFSLRHPWLREGAVPLALTGALAPRRLDIASGTSAGAPLIQRGSLELGDRAGDFDLRLALALWQGTAEVGVLERAGGKQVRWDVRGVDLRPDLVLSSPGLGALRGRLTSSGSATMSAAGTPTLAGTLGLAWEGAQIAGRAVDRLSIEATAEPGLVRVKSAEGRIGPNDLRLALVDLPAPALFSGRWRALLASASGSFAASLGDVPGFMAIWGLNARRAGARMPAHRLRLEGTLGKGTVRLSRGELAAGPGTATLEAFTLGLPGENQGWDQTAFSGSAAVDLPRLEDVSAVLPLPALGGSIRGVVSGRGTVARPEGTATLAGRQVTIAGKAIGDVEVTARAAAGRLELDSLQVRRGGNRLDAKGVRLSTAALASSDRAALVDSLAGSFELRFTDIPALAALASAPPAGLARLPARHVLTAAGTVSGRTIALAGGSFATAGSTATLRAARITLPAPGGDWKRDTTLDGDLDVDVPDLAPVGRIFDVPPLQGRLKGHAKVAGSAREPTGTLELSGAGIAVGAHRVGDVVAKLSARGRLVAVESLEIARGPDRLRGSGSWDLDKETALSLEADVSVADVAPWAAQYVSARLPVSGRLHARIRADGPVPGAPIAVDAEVSGGTFQDLRAVRGTLKASVGVEGPLRRPRIASAALTAQADGEAGTRSGHATIDASYEPGTLRVRALDARGSGGLTLHGDGTLALDLSSRDVLGPGPLAFRARVHMPHLDDVSALLPPAYRLAGSLDADLALAGTWKDPQLRAELDARGLALDAAPPFVSPGPYTLAGTLAWSASEARAERVRLESPALSCSLSGTWTAPPSPRAVLSREARLAAGSLSLRATFSSPDVGWLRAAAEGIRHVRGSVAGEIAVEGTPADPIFSGSVSVADGAVQYRGLPPLDSLAARLSLARRTLTVEQLGGNVGASPFALSGSVDFTRLSDPAFDLRLQGKNALLYRAEGLRLRADSDLRLRGTAGAPSLSGEVALTDSIYQRTFSVADVFGGGSGSGTSSKRASAGTSGISFPDPPLRDLRFDVRLTAREPFEIATTVLKGTAAPDLRLTGTGLLPVLRGTILFQDARLFLPSGTLEVERGTMLFRESDPAHPELDFAGRMQTRGFDITAQISGTLDKPEVILSSLPPLPSDELVTFVLTGAPPASARLAGESAATLATPMAVYLGKGVLESLLGGAGGGGARLQDQLEMQVGRELTRSGSQTMDARLLLRKGLAGHGSSLYLTGQKDVYDQENIGVEILFKFK